MSVEERTGKIHGREGADVVLAADWKVRFRARFAVNALVAEAEFARAYSRCYLGTQEAVRGAAAAAGPPTVADALRNLDGKARR